MHMSFDFKKFNSQFEKISDEFENLLKNIKDFDEIEIPSRNEQVNRNYMQKLKSIFKNTNIYFQESENSVNNQKTMKKTNTEIINSLIDQINTEPGQKLKILREIFNLIEEISEEDKNVILLTLENSNIDEIKKSIIDIMQAFQ